LERIATVARWVGKHTWRSIAEGMTPLIIGGDHSFAMGSISAAAQRVPGLGVVWIDAHPDFNTPETSPTSNIHGMVLAIAAGLGPTRCPGVSTPATGGLTGEQLVQAVRSVGQWTRIVSMDIAEFTPSEDVDGVTAEAAIRVAEAALTASAGANGPRVLQA